jgi:hypothetical protein
VTTVQQIYDTFCSRILEPGGLQLGIITPAQFLLYMADAINGLLRDTGISRTFVTQTINQGVRLYSYPDRLMNLGAVFVQGRYVARSNLESIDNSNYQWRSKSGPVKAWHEDGLAVNSVELVPMPNWQGTIYPTPGYQYIDGTQIGTFAGAVTSAGGNLLAWASGDLFQIADSTWFGKAIVVAGTPYIIQTVLDATNLNVTAPVPAGVALGYSVTYPIALPASDRNLTCYGSQMPTSSAYALNSPIPLIPDSATMYLGWAILAKVFSDDCELKDKQKAMYCGARYTEGVQLLKAIMAEEIEDDDD